MSSEKLGKQLESQVSEASVKITDLQRELGEVVSLKNRLQQQHVDLTHRADDTANQLDQANRAKTVLAQQLEEAKQALDDETSVRNKVKIDYILQKTCVSSIMVYR